MWKFDDYEDYGEPTNEELETIQYECLDVDDMSVTCPQCRKEFNLVGIKYVASDPQCPHCGHIYGGEY